MDIVVTDFGPVRLSAKTLAWLDSLAADWRQILTSKRKRGKRAEFVRDRVRRLEGAVMLAAEIMFCSGGLLEEF